jgi:hypothetical protein
VETIGNDALSRGAEKMDRESISDLFTWDDDKNTMATLQDDWDNARDRLYEERLTVPAIKRILVDMREINFRFMHLGTRRFHEMVDSGWRDEPNAMQERTMAAPGLSPASASPATRH